MLHLRHLTRLLVVIALLATGLALAISSPAGAQSTIRVITFESADDSDWEVQITVQSLGGCDPPNARPGYVTSWLDDTDEDGEVLDPGVCNYRITALARHTDSPGRLCPAGVRWGDSGTFESAIQTSTRPTDETTVQAEHTGVGTANCSAQPTLAITINPDAGEDGVVQPLPKSATDSNLEARAERVVEITEFRVKVTPASTSINRTGCNQTLDFFVLGDGDEVEKALSPLGSGVTCEFRITVTEAPAPFIIRDTNGESFSTGDQDADGTIDLDLSEHVQLPWSPIVIIQDVVNNPGNQGSAAYKVTSTCAGVPSLPPIAIGGNASGIYTRPGGQTVASLLNGRFTVHSPDFANFGVGAVYPAVATSTTSDEIGGCSVTASIEGLTEGCTLAGTSTRTLTWTARQPDAELQLLVRVRHLLQRDAAARGQRAAAGAVERGLVGDDHRRDLELGRRRHRRRAHRRPPAGQREDRVRSAAVAGRRLLG